MQAIKQRNRRTRGHRASDYGSSGANHPCHAFRHAGYAQPDVSDPRTVTSDEPSLLAPAIDPCQANTCGSPAHRQRARPAWRVLKHAIESHRIAKKTRRPIKIGHDQLDVEY